ncbi:uncharacterized protein LOC132195644 isoform X1 [Neocloeon triangulifer]|uniref:uncharacterized protein LOC132195644 isoform X1 n=1 Tax=Neocloeon triangulifer TaxID=2078957 RepID=UPI00286F8012|nr:uncharacterized protein LOC132195644 isoform X1 [Neocloeon triangulifer]
MDKILMFEVKEEVAEKREEMISHVKDLLTENNRNIDSVEKHLKSVVMKAMFCTLNIFSLFAGTFLLPALIIDETYGSHITKNDDMNPDLLFSNRFNNISMLIAEYKKQRRFSDEIKSIEKVKALKAVMAIEANINETVIDDEQRKAVGVIVDDYNKAKSESNSTSFVLMPILEEVFEFVRKALARKIAILEYENGSIGKINDLKSAEVKFKNADIIASGCAAFELANTYGQDDATLVVIHSAIESNAVALREMARYDQILNDQMLPKLEYMLEILSEMQSDNKDITMAMLRLRKLNLKKQARRFNTLIKEFAHEFAGVCDSGSLLMYLEAYMVLLINSYDLLNGAEYAIQLKAFIGRVDTGDCSRSEDLIACFRNENLVTQIRADEIFRNCLQIFNSYQQVLFPYGGDVTLRNTFAQLNELNAKSYSIEAKAEVLQSATNLIIYDLQTIQNEIDPVKDSTLIHTAFNSVVFEPFFTWPNTKFGTQIKRLLSGEKVTLSASVFSLGVRNVVKYNSVMLNVKSSDLSANRALQDLLNHFEVEMESLGDMHYRCGDSFYVSSSQPVQFERCFEMERETFPCHSRNTVINQTLHFDTFKVTPSPYTVWNFRLVHRSAIDKQQLLDELKTFSNSVDLELVGTGSFILENAPICDLKLSRQHIKKTR